MKIREILEWMDREEEEYRFWGNPDEEIEGFSSLNFYRQNTMTWVKNQEKYDGLPVKPVVMLAVAQQGVDVQAKNRILSKNSKQLFFSILEQFWGDKRAGERIGKGTVLTGSVQLGTDVVIGSNCTINGDVSIGNRTVIGDNVVIVNRVAIGADCRIQALSVIGEDGFGYYEEESGRKTMIRHYGGVEIGDNVFIGSHVNIARGVIDNTVIGCGTKIAPSTHIGHNNRIGKNCAVICANLFGSVETGDRAYIVSSTVKNQCRVGEGALVGMGSVVTRDVEAGAVAVGAPARKIRDNGTV